MNRYMDLIAYGHAGLPVLVFPSSEGSADGYEGFGMVGVLAPLIDAGKVRLYCVGSDDSESWWSKHVPLNERAWRHSLYEDWIVKQVVPAIRHELKDSKARLLTTGCSFGAYHAANFTLKHPRMFWYALGLSGAYDIRWLMHGHHDDWVYFNNPIEYVPNLHGEFLEELRKSVFIHLVCGQGAWEDRSQSSSREVWWQLRDKGIPNYLDLWGHDVNHDWPWWRTQIVYYLGNLVEGKTPWLNT